MHRNPLIPPNEFHERVVPELLRRYDIHCYCGNTNFLKLISFNFENYGIAPTALYDTEIVIGSVMLGRLEPVGKWHGNGERADRCRQCGQVFHTRYDEYSINMMRSAMRPDELLPMASAGLYVTGFRYFTKYEHELDRIVDFQPAKSVEEFIAAITDVRRENRAI